VPLLQYHHGVALKEAGRQPEARALFEALMRQYPDRPEAAEAALRRGQCLWEEGWQATEQANAKLGAPDVKPAEAAAANKALEEAGKTVREALRYLEEQADRLKDREPAPEVRARMLYEAAWGYRALADQEVGAARGKMQEELLKKLQEEAAKKTPEGQPPPMVEPQEVPLEKVPLQPSEKKARALFQELITSFPDLPLSLEVRLQFAEWHADRFADYAAAVKLLAEALDKEPPADLTDRLRLRLGVCHAARGDAKAALRQFEALLANPEGPLAGQAHYRAAEALMGQGQWAEAVKHLAVFRDVEAFQNLPELTDVPLLRLGHALARLGEWGPSRQAHETLLARFADSAWAAEARYGIGWALRQEKKYDEAAEAFTQAAADMASPTAARAQLLVGVGLMEQKKYAEAAEALAGVAAKPYPDLAALALVEAAAAHAKLEQKDEAEKLLRQVVRDHPEGKWAAVAKERLKAPAAAPLPHELPEALRLLTPDLGQPPALGGLSGYQPDRAPLDDPTAEASLAFALSRTPPDRAAPAAAVRQTVPDPFEYRHAVRGKVPPEDDRLPPDLAPQPPRR
jgi:tetratricopeptide (TPR) repeat protein